MDAISRKNENGITYAQSTILTDKASARSIKLAKLTCYVKRIRKCWTYLWSGTKKYIEQFIINVRCYDERSWSKIPKFSVLQFFKKNKARLACYSWQINNLSETWYCLHVKCIQISLTKALNDLKINEWRIWVFSF